MIDESGGCKDVPNPRWVTKVVNVKVLLVLGSHLLARNFMTCSQFLPATPISFVIVMFMQHAKKKKKKLSDHDKLRCKIRLKEINV